MKPNQNMKKRILEGTVQSSLFRTLNAEDGEQYNKELTTFKQNQQ